MAHEHLYILRKPAKGEKTAPLKFSRKMVVDQFCPDLGALVRYYLSLKYGFCKTEFSKKVVSSHRQRPTRRETTFARMAISGRNKSFGNVSYHLSGMDPSPRLGFSELSPEQLLGPLNNVEWKFAPRKLFVAGSMEIPLPRPRVAIVGSRKASTKGLDEAARITRSLVKRGVVIVSGLAEGIDTVAHTTAIEREGRTVAVLGTPLNRNYPRKNLQLQKEIMTNHLAVSQFPVGYPIQPKNFVLRNRTMALLSNASVIVEAGETSGSLHQGWEALRLGRPLFIRKHVLEDRLLSWPKRMIRYGALELSDPKQVLTVLPPPRRLIEIPVRI